MMSMGALQASMMMAAGDMQILEGLLAEIGQHMGTLRRLTDSIALLDMLCSLAHVASTKDPPYVRPAVGEEGSIAIIAGRHPTLECRQEGRCQPNDTYLADSSSFYVVSGPNMSGKTTYLKQVTAALSAVIDDQNQAVCMSLFT